MTNLERFARMACGEAVYTSNTRRRTAMKITKVTLRDGGVGISYTTTSRGGVESRQTDRVDEGSLWLNTWTLYDTASAAAAAAREAFDRTSGLERSVLLYGAH